MDDLAINRGDAPTDSAAMHRRGYNKVLKVAISIFIALNAIILLQSQSDSKAMILNHIYAVRDALESWSVSVSGWVHRLPGVIDTSTRVFIDAKNTETSGTVMRSKTISAEGADMEWEKSESLLRQLNSWGNKRGGAVENNVLHGAFEALEGIFNIWTNKEGENIINAVKKNGPPQKGKKSQDHRRLKATNNEEQQGRYASKQVVEKMFFDVLSTISSSPISAVVLIFCVVAFLIVSIVVSPDSRLLRRLANSHENRTIVLDEDEAEIVEFYEKEMESGTQCIPFLEDIHLANECKEDDTNDEKKRFQSFIRCPSSDSSLTRHSGEARVSQCDSYYSRVLQDINSFDEVVDDPGVEERVCVNDCCADDLVKPSAQEQTSNEDAECSSNPTSSSSSISPLTSEAYADIESPPSQPQEFAEISSSNVTYPATNATPTSNVRRRCLERETKASRCVSFSPVVKVLEVPRQINSEMSSEKYLYLMLMAVAIVITFCALLPAPHPSLSVPISDMTAVKMIQRASTILNSQWEVEL